MRITDAGEPIRGKGEQDQQQDAGAALGQPSRHVFGMQADGQLDAGEIERGEGEHQQAEDERDAPHRLDGGVGDRLGVEALAFDGAAAGAASGRPTSKRDRHRRPAPRAPSAADGLDAEERGCSAVRLRRAVCMD